MEWVLSGLWMLTLSGVFFAGWKLGSKNSENKIRAKLLEEINQHAKKYAKDSNSVDAKIDHVKSILGDSGVRESAGAGKVRKTK